MENKTVYLTVFVQLVKTYWENNLGQVVVNLDGTSLSRIYAYVIT